MKFLSEHTLIPLGLAVITIGGGTAWLTTLHYATASNTEIVRRIEEKQDQYFEELHEVNERLSRIEGELKRIKR